MSAHHDPSPSLPLPRRAVLAAAAGLVLVRPAAAATGPLDAAVRTYTEGAPVTPARVTLEVSPLVENGNTVPLAVRVDSPMTEADHVRRIAVFNERNPQREVAVFTLGPRAGRAAVATRIRLATSQRLVALAQTSDGRWWSASADVIVTLAGCVEG